MKLKAMMNEANEQWREAETLYAKILEKEPANTVKQQKTPHLSASDEKTNHSSKGNGRFEQLR